MTLIVSDLYERIMQANADEFDCLRVITGYSSGDFIKKVLSDFPNLNIELYLGMARQGVSIRDHEYYQFITQKGVAKVCYVTDKPMIHQKVMEFYNSRDRIGYVGSANFSFNGFFEQREIMVVADNNLDAVFQMAASQSMSCLDEQIEKVIPLVETVQTEDSSATENHFGEQNDVHEEKPIEGESELSFGAGVQWQTCHTTNMMNTLISQSFVRKSHQSGPRSMMISRISA